MRDLVVDVIGKVESIISRFLAMCAGRAMLMMIDRSSRKALFAVRYGILVDFHPR